MSRDPTIFNLRAIGLCALCALVLLASGCTSAEAPVAENGDRSQVQVAATQSANAMASLATATRPAAPPNRPASTATRTPADTPTQLPATATPLPQPSATPGPTDTPTWAADVVVAVDVLNFRSGPGTNYDTISRLRRDAPLAVAGRNAAGDWLVVVAEDGTWGWVYAPMTTASVDTGAVAVAATVPPPPAAAPMRAAQAPARPQNPPPALPPPAPAGAAPDLNPLTGLPANSAALTRRPVLVRVGNDPVARGVQAGLSLADVVYEEIMDGWGVTRYTGIFWSQDPGNVRPVRSARLVSIDLAQQYQGALAHSGASDPIRLRLSQAPIVDLDEFFHSPPYTYGPGDWRTRLYTSLPRLRQYLRSKGLDQPVSLRSWAFSEQPAAGSPAPAATVRYPNGTVVWRWDSAIGRYRRFIGGVPDIDANTGQQITAANVVLLYALHAATDIVEDSLGSTAIDIRLHGSGPVKVMRDGVVSDGTWQRVDEFQPTQFSVPLKPGNVWVELIPTNVRDYHPSIG
jgi:hypothetical protein